MKRLLSVALSLWMVLAVLPAGSFAAEPTATVMGKVTEDREDGDPVGGAKVVARDPQGNILGTAVSNAEGNYSMILPVGAQYVLSLEPPPFYSQEAPDTPPRGVLTGQGLVVNWIVDDDEAIAWFGGGAVVVTGAIVGGILGSQGNGGGKKRIVTGTQ